MSLVFNNMLCLNQVCLPSLLHNQIFNLHTQTPHDGCHDGATCVVHQNMHTRVCRVQEHPCCDYTIGTEEVMVVEQSSNAWLCTPLS